jgi:hypothetical protein
MLSPVKLWKAYSDFNKIEAVAKERTPMTVKIPQLLHGIGTLAAVIGVPTLAHNWLAQPEHAGIFAALVSLSVLLHVISPTIFAGPSDAVQQQADAAVAAAAAQQAAAAQNIIAKVVVGALLLGPGLAFPTHLKAQTATPDIQNLYAAGGSYSVNASPSVAGTALYAHALNVSGTYAFTAVDALPNTMKPFTVTTNIGAGIAQKVFTLGNVPVYVPTAAGISWSGTNTGWQWNGGALVAIKVKGNYYLMPSLRFMKSSVSNGTGYQPIFGLLIGWGK